MSVFGNKGPFGGRKSLFGDEGSENVVVDLNLTPLMDVLSNILFFLMASFGAAIVSFLSASAPVQADPDTEELAPEKIDKVTVNIQLKRENIRVNCSSSKVKPSDLEFCKKNIGRGKKGGHDLEALHEHVYGIKTKWPASDTAIIVPDQVTIYEEITQTIEAVKYRREDKKKIKILTKVVVADLVQADVVE